MSFDCFIVGNWDITVSYYEMVGKTVKDPMVKAALSIAYVKANREEEAEKLCKFLCPNEGTPFSLFLLINFSLLLRFIC